MTENEAIKQFEDMIKYWDGNESEVADYIEAMKVAVASLKEIQQYRVIGIVEECREAIEKQKGRKPIKGDPYYWVNSVKVGRRYKDVRKKSHENLCPSCKHNVAKLSCDYCPGCGQKLDWNETV